MSLPRRTSFLVLTVLTLMWIAEPTHAQSRYVYAVNYACGFQSSADGSNDYEPLVKVANYAVKIDFHNFGEVDVQLAGSVLDTTSSAWLSSPAPIALTQGSLTAGGATVLDCTDIEAAVSGGSGPPAGKPFLSGVVTISSLEPLIVWATKTTEVCAGLVQVSETAVLDPDIIVFDEEMNPILPGMPLPPAAPVLFGCPSALSYNSQYGGGAPSGPFPGPGGSVPPGLRSRQVTPSLGSDAIAEDLSISHSIDYERVEGVLVP
ncbi:MAG: hypothetical protein AAF560_32940 [Acidobacteriota bacterium]